MKTLKRKVKGVVLAMLRVKPGTGEALSHRIKASGSTEARDGIRRFAGERLRNIRGRRTRVVRSFRQGVPV
jgi:hypothetical protein